MKVAYHNIYMLCCARCVNMRCVNTIWPDCLTHWLQTNDFGCETQFWKPVLEPCTYVTNCTSRWGPEQSQSYLLVQKSCQTLWFPESKIKLITQVCNKWLCCMPSINVGQSCTQSNVLCYRQGICWGCFVLMHARLLVSNLHFWQASDFPPSKRTL